MQPKQFGIKEPREKSRHRIIAHCDNKWLMFTQEGKLDDLVLTRIKLNRNCNTKVIHTLCSCEFTSWKKTRLIQQCRWIIEDQQIKLQIKEGSTNEKTSNGNIDRRWDKCITDTFQYKALKTISFPVSCFTNIVQWKGALLMSRWYKFEQTLHDTKISHMSRN
jgi:hypothetical protein